MEEQFTCFIYITYQGKQNGSVLLTNERCTEQMEQTQILSHTKFKCVVQMRPWTSVLIIKLSLLVRCPDFRGLNVCTLIQMGPWTSVLIIKVSAHTQQTVINHTNGYTLTDGGYTCCYTLTDGGYTHMHTLLHTHTHTHTHTVTHTHTHTHACTHAHTRTHAYTLLHTQMAVTHAVTHSQRVVTHTHTHTEGCTLTSNKDGYSMQTNTRWVFQLASPEVHSRSYFPRSVFLS